MAYVRSTKRTDWSKISGSSKDYNIETEGEAGLWFLHHNE